MNQFKEEFLGRVKGSRRAATCQKCLRTGDLENVGRTPDHHTFFEMLGNFSFGDYFKKEAIVWAWEFLTKELGLKGKDLWVSVYEDDSEAYDIWRNVIKVPRDKILKLGAKENFWPSDAPAKGPNGPCGPCSEIFYGGPDGVEVWNLVFTQFDRRDGGRLEPLPNKNIDTGMGLERLARVLQGKKTNFEIDSFQPIIEAIKGKGKGEGSKINAIADHIRAVVFAIADGVLPSNEERGYVIRKLIRKAFWYGRAFGLEKPFLYKLVPTVARAMKKPYPGLIEQREDIAQVVLAEEKRFRNTLQDGLEKLNMMIEESKASGILAGGEVFKLYDTYGFPLELTREIAGVEDIDVDMQGFEKCMEGQRAKSRQQSKMVSDSIFVEGASRALAELPEKTPFVKDKGKIETRILHKQENKIFLEKTNFYGEKGGQVGDTGWLLKDNKVAADVVNAIDIAGRVQHEVKLKGALKAGDKITAKIDITRRENIKKNHTATHLLHHALRKVLGLHVKQSGSLVAPDRLRFDFTHFKALNDEEISRVEELVNECIKKDSCVGTKVLAFSEAKDSGAIALFGEKYGDEVSMVSVGDYSKELCGGTHVSQTKDIGLFSIISESSIASGVRRIEAITGDAASKKIREEQDLIKKIAGELKTMPDNILKEIERISGRLKTLERELGSLSNGFIRSSIDGLLSNVKKIKERDVIVAEVKAMDMALLRKASDIIKGRLKKGVFVLVSQKEGKLSMVVGVCGEKKLSAAKILNDIGADFGIKGGGRPDFAQAGGRPGPAIKDILKKAERVIGQKVGAE